MKVNKIFHWLYFLMLLLPIFVIPIFAIFTRNENSTFAQEITVQENKVVDFNQLVPNNQRNYENGNFVDLRDYTTFAVQVWNDNVYQGDMFITYTQNVGSFQQVLTSSYVGNRVIYKHSGSSLDLIFADFNANIDNGYKYFVDIDFIKVNPSIADGFEVKNNQFVNLSRMFGLGNEPTKEQFKYWYPNDYYEYTLSDKQLLKNVSTVTYNDTDIGSQFTYTIYNSIDKYFNYDNVFNFGDLYDWLQLNFFNGNAPLGFFIFWHYLIYFLLTSLLWLLFDVLMYVPNLIHKWLDKAS